MAPLLGGSLLLLAIALVIIGAAAAVIARVHLSSDERASGTLGHALSQVQSLIEPSRKNVIETKRVDQRRPDDRAGDPPRP